MVCALVACGITACASMQSGRMEAGRLVAGTDRIAQLLARSQPNLVSKANRARGVLIAPQIRTSRTHCWRIGRPRRTRRARRPDMESSAFYDLATAVSDFRPASYRGGDRGDGQGFQFLLSRSFKIGGDASVALGPVGAGGAVDGHCRSDRVTRARACTVASTWTARSWCKRGMDDAFYGRTSVMPNAHSYQTVTHPDAVPLLSDLAAATR
jgi:hypothetical protein